MNLILLGAPGAGKGTQATKIAERYGLVHISTGDIFRANIKNGTEIGKLAKSYIDRGELVPDEVTVAIVKDRLTWDDIKNAKGYLLDGFPRNLYQAEELDKFAHIDGVVNINIDFKLLMDRLCGRRVCSKCGESYHVRLHPERRDDVRTLRRRALSAQGRQSRDRRKPPQRLQRADGAPHRLLHEERHHPQRHGHRGSRRSAVRAGQGCAR